MSEPTSEARPSTPFPSESAAPAGAPADPLDGDWSEGLRGPVRALGIPAPRLLTAQGVAEPEPVPPAVAAIPAQDETVEAPDAWSVADDDPLHSAPPPVAQDLPAAHGSTLESALEAASAQHAEVAALPAELASAAESAGPLAAEAPEQPHDSAALEAHDGVVELPAAEALDAHELMDGPPAHEHEPQLSLETHEGVVELPAAEALDAHDGELLEPEPLAPFDDGEEPAPHAETAAWAQAIADHSPPESSAPLWSEATVISSAPVPLPGWSGATPADPQPAWAGATPAEAQPAWDRASDAPPAAPAWDAHRAAATPAGAPAASDGASADWSAVSSGPDWSAPAAAPASSQEGWGAPPPPAAESAWTQSSPAAPASEWQAAAAPAARAAPTAPSTMEQLLANDREPPRREPDGALFAPLPQGESLSPEDSGFIDSDPDLPVPFEEPQSRPQPPRPLAQIETVSGLAVEGEHRVAVHTRGGRTLRGSVHDIDLSKSQFSLVPQGSSTPEPVYHAEVKAIFFMLPPGEKPRPASGGRVRVTFADGRAIDGTRDGGEGKHGFFLVPADAARTNTRRIYVAREAISDLKDG